MLFIFVDSRSFWSMKRQLTWTTKRSVKLSTRSVGRSAAPRCCSSRTAPPACWSARAWSCWRAGGWWSCARPTRPSPIMTRISINWCVGMCDSFPTDPALCGFTRSVLKYARLHRYRVEMCNTRGGLECLALFIIYWYARLPLLMSWK